MSYADILQPCIRYLCVFCTVQVKLLSTTPNTIGLTWSEAGSVSLNDFDIEISWKSSSADLCQYEDTYSTMIISGLMPNATIDGLEEYSSYNITVTIGSSISNSTIAMTKESGTLNLIVKYVEPMKVTKGHCFSFQLHLLLQLISSS